MCEDRGMVIGGLIIAAAMLVWAFASHHTGADTRAPRAAHTAAQTSLAVAIDPLALEVRHGRFVVEFGL
ncbi:MAG: hypothetical protein IT547_14535 [Hyphomonadaceae bacterium]|nr:hypothetical protein [Hyphomonadaceae bacterium]